MESAVEACSKIYKYANDKFKAVDGIVSPKTKKEWNKVFKNKKHRLDDVEDGAQLAGELYSWLSLSYKHLDFSTKVYAGLKKEHEVLLSEKEGLVAKIESQVKSDTISDVENPQTDMQQDEVAGASQDSSDCMTPHSHESPKDKQPVMTPEQFETAAKTIIGSLLMRADNLTKTVITAFEPTASRSANISSLNTSKFVMESLEACAVLLNIELADADSNKLFTKQTLCSRIVAALFALLPSTCTACSETYTTEFDSPNPPLFECYRCFQGSHSCDAIMKKHQALKDVGLLTDGLTCSLGSANSVWTRPILSHPVKAKLNTLVYLGLKL